MCSNEELIAPPLDELGQAELKIKELEDNVNDHNSKKYYSLKRYAIYGMLCDLQCFVKSLQDQQNIFRFSVNDLSELSEKTSDLFADFCTIDISITNEMVEQKKKSSYNCDKE